MGRIEDTFVVAVAVDVGGVEKVYAEINCPGKDLKALFLGFSRSISK
jgi:hypothetical protein